MNFLGGMTPTFFFCVAMLLNRSARQVRRDSLRRGCTWKTRKNKRMYRAINSRSGQETTSMNFDLLSHLRQWYDKHNEIRWPMCLYYTHESRWKVTEEEQQLEEVYKFLLKSELLSLQQRFPDYWNLNHNLFIVLNIFTKIINLQPQ